jgi:hypothetical protein
LQGNSKQDDKIYGSKWRLNFFRISLWYLSLYIARKSSTFHFQRSPSQRIWYNLWNWLD